MQKRIAIIGGGHNGLVCACYLAEAGHQVSVVEKATQLGGAAVTEEFHPGFRNSVASYTVGMLDPKVIEDLQLHENGLAIVERPISNFVPFENGSYLKLGGSLEATQKEFAKFSIKDAERLPAYYKLLEEVAAVARPLMFEPPISFSNGLSHMVQSILKSHRLSKLSLQTQQDALDIFTLSAAEFLNRWFESDQVKAAFGFDSIIGSFTSPYEAGSAYVLLHHVIGETNGKDGVWGHAIGGMGAITQAMAKQAKTLGVKFLTDSEVTSIKPRYGSKKQFFVQIRGNQKDNIICDAIAANVTPNVLFQQLLEPELLSDAFNTRIENWHSHSATFRMNIALSELPDFKALPGKDCAQHHQSGIVIGPSLGYLDAAYHEARKEGYSKRPFIEMLIPSTLDDSLAPRGQHVASLFCQQFSYDLVPGMSWETAKQGAIDVIIQTVDQYAPNFSDSILGIQALSPLDLENKFGLTRGDIFHGALRLNQLYQARPAINYANYKMPLEGLYLCGSGAHPGGGVSGVPGKNCALQMLKDI